MTAREIIDRANAGETLGIPALYAMEFMRECERHNINCELHVKIERGVATISKTKASPLPMRQFCTWCGKDVSEGDYAKGICPHCGAGGKRG